MINDQEEDPRTLRLLDLAAHDVIIARCECGRIVEFRQGVLQRLHRVPSTTLVFDLQFKLRCKQCGRRDGFAISIMDERCRGDSSKVKGERVIVGRGK